MSNQQHFSEQEIAKCAEAIVDGTFNQLDSRYSTHLAECDTCANEVTMVSSILEEETILIAETEVKIPEKQNKTFPLNKTIIWSAAAVVILFIGFKALINNQSTTNKNIAQVSINDTLINTKKPDSTPIAPSKNQVQIADKKPENVIIEPQKQIISEPQKTELLAYAPNPKLDKLAERYMGAAMRGDDIKITSPNTLESSTDKLILEWENTSQQLLIVEFFNNNGEKIFEIETSNNNYKPEKITKKGLYYWKLINEDFDLLFCGKIILK